jgi:hypothetical protein
MLDGDFFGSLAVPVSDLCHDVIELWLQVRTL